jgi:hypothetical protein
MNAKELTNENQLPYTPTEGAALLEMGARKKMPNAGTYSLEDHKIKCESNTNLLSLDKSFRKEDFCKDHGNGIEVVCLEKFYQDVMSTLPTADAVVMFSPGFPQLGRRTWDPVLRKLLDQGTVLMVGDQMNRKSWDWKEKVKPGGRWKVHRSSEEDGMTWIGLDAYGARRLGAWRSPFPLLIDEGKSRKVAKNAVLQIFSGRRAGVKRETMPSKRRNDANRALVENFDFKRAFGADDADFAQELKEALLQPVFVGVSWMWCRCVRRRPSSYLG